MNRHSKSHSSESEIQREARRFSKWFESLLAKTEAKAKVTDTMRKEWAETYEKLRRIDGFSKEEIKAICEWARGDDFWRPNFLTANKLRRKNREGVKFIDVFRNKMPQKPSAASDPTAPPPNWRQIFTEICLPEIAGATRPQDKAVYPSDPNEWAWDAPDANRTGKSFIVPVSFKEDVIKEAKRREGLKA